MKLMNFRLFVFSVILTALCGIISVQVNQKVPDVYMDEIFHVRQTKAYYDGNFYDWDPKITTFPGLYVIAWRFVRTLHLFSEGRLVCTTPVLRSLNVVFGIANMLLFYQILKKLYPQFSENQLILRSVCAFAFPLLFFFNFLYYTDLGSTFFVFLTYYLSLDKRYKSSALAASFAIFFRQTNVIWVAFSLAVDVVDMFYKQKKVDSDSKNTVNTEELNFQIIKQFILFCLTNIHIIIAKFWHFLVLLVGFLAFVVINKGIVIGDRTAHAPVFHFAQILYFLAFSLVFMIPNLRTLTISSLQSFASDLLKHNIFIMLIYIATFGCLVFHFSPAHLYLLSDNRHYTFYIWRRILDKYSVKYLLLPVYTYAFWIFWKDIRRKRSSLWCLGFFACVFVVLVPAFLLEFRYFIVPFLFIYLHTQNEVKTSGVISQMLFFAVVNIFTLYMFLERPYTWPDGEEARIMW